MMHPSRTKRPKRCSGGKSESITKGRANIGIRSPPQGKLGILQKPSAQTSSLISAAVGVVAPRAFLTSFCRIPGSRSKLLIPGRSSVVELTWIIPPPTPELSGQ
jgi:hypothetical protein